MKKLFTIKGRISLLLGSFFLLVIVSVGVMFWSVRTQNSDALIINLAGRQRMLSQKLTWLATTDPSNPEFQSSKELFDQSLSALQFGGDAIDSAGNNVVLPAPPDDEIQGLLEDVSQSWVSFQLVLQKPDEFLIAQESSVILDQLDLIVTAFELRAEEKILRLEIIQISFLIAAILLLTWGFIITQERIIKPLSVLNTGVEKMADGDLQWQIPTFKKDELGDLAKAFETMRSELEISRGYLETQVTQRTRELVSAFEFSQEIVAEREQKELISSVVERARLLMNAESAALCILSPGEKELEMVANSGKTKIAIGSRKEVKPELILSVVGDGKTVSEKTGCIDCAFLDENPDGQCVITPLRSMDRTIGALCVLRTDEDQNTDIESFDPDGQRALALLANSAAVAITNTRLAKIEHQKVEQEAALAEREQLAANLHDDLAQTLSFSRLKLEQLEELIAETPVEEDLTHIDEIKDAIDSAYQQVRNALTGLLVPNPVEDDFYKSLSASVAEFNLDQKCQAELEIINPSALEFPSEIQIQIHHVLREALSNIQRHADASKVMIKVEKINGMAMYTVEDDGKGFDPQAPNGHNHFGLQIMQTRTERSGGVFEIQSALGNGTMILLSFPLELRKRFIRQTI
ncbi:MAG: GAF domain-containing protein [Chloroflexi bacterium]|jgi:two-component system, NarL family, nitrate/nitrite sensor histidine kinase NarX|nr:GAF domain-containing protein [Chloroflexota bacterium]MBT3670336.1 GAF domain-containing protein [Chloroflexota bacterium]MBT4305523.1 GAF domain-containing protein [Chloroflexota bacterium]MBT4533135.1 GAF domain-containing protein [Chloroflexota bacterium]MBT4682083.1 GAF domain-containing protein [Chloroflexota bacterium]